jgi:hypothetical protein
MFRALVSIGALALLAGAAPLRAQGTHLRVGAGLALPVGDAGDRYRAGPLYMASLQAPLGGLWSVRFDGEWSRVNGREYVPPGGPRPAPDLRAAGGSLNAVRHLSRARAAPYLLAGMGAYRLQRVGDRPSVYGTTPMVQLGLGVDATVLRRINPFAEVRAQVHLTDYAADELHASVFRPVVVGVRIR